MPPKVQITREMMVDAGLEIVRSEGHEALNLRRLAEYLGCSTRPMTYRFENAEELKRAVYKKADELHTDYIMNIDPEKGVMLSIGLNYIRFGANEPRLFRFLFQSGLAKGGSMAEIIEAEEMSPILAAMGTAMGVSPDETKRIFLIIALFAHGYASLIAGSSMKFDEKVIAEHLECAYRGAVLAVREETGSA
ncbi:MAG: TetR/AcrR family transcriptional regulator [Oscillospiraceae bacterium]|nr:TetR/AcrR family transcriptional regulator [Oscillospiraceae bacterium]